MANLKKTHVITTTNGDDRGNEARWHVAIVGALLFATIAIFFMTV